MFTKLRIKLLITAISLLTINTAVIAQSASKEIKKLVKDFSKAYNAKDHTAIASMFTTDAVRVEPDGKTTNGAAQIGESYAQSFSGADQKADIKLLSVKEDGEGKAIANGTYSVTGTVKSSGEKIAIAGIYENTVVKENGKWKISHMKLSAAK